jgi:hypothetical protein
LCQYGGTGATGPTGAAGALAVFGSRDQNADAGHNCLTMSNVSKAGACNTTFASFQGNDNQQGYGPTPSGGLTILSAFASAAPGGTGNTTIDVIAVDSSNVTTVVLSCAVGPAATSCTNAGPAVASGGVFLQIRVTLGTGNGARQWRASFQ